MSTMKRPASPHQPLHRWRAAGTVLAGLAAAWPVVVCSQTAPAAVYRCGNTYVDQPCPGGAPVDAADPRSAEQQKAAQAAVKRDAAMADRLAAERRARERAAAGQMAVGIGPLAASAPAAADKGRKPPKPKAVKKPAKKPAELGSAG